VPAPPPADVGRYRLTDAQGQLTEKRLRSLLARCPEWNDPEERLRLAGALEAEEALSGDASGAVEVLRSHRCADMRKHAMLRLAHCWRYKGDCWSARPSGSGERKRTRRRAAPDAAVAEAPPQLKRTATEAATMQLALADRTLAVSQAAQAQALGLVSPYIAAAARAWTGPLSAVQYGRVRGEGMTWLRVRTIEGAHEVSFWLRNVLLQRLRGLRAWRATLDAETLRQPAFLCEAAYASPDSELEGLRNILMHGRASTDSVAEKSRQPDGSLLPQHAAWVHDFHTGYAAVMGLVGAAKAFVSAQRMEPLRCYLDASEAVLEGCAAYTRDTQTALEQRVEWTSEAAASQGAAAGSKAEARAALAPLVQRLRLTGDDPDGARLLALASTPPPLGSPLQPFVIAAPGAPQPPPPMLQQQQWPMLPLH
jgi:hypothetical protein